MYKKELNFKPKGKHGRVLLFKNVQYAQKRDENSCKVLQIFFGKYSKKY